MNRRIAVSVFLLSLGSLWLCQTSFAADGNWIEVQSPHFRVLSDGSEKNALAVAKEFEQIRSAFSRVLPGLRSDTRIPFLIIAATDEASARNLMPQYWKAKGVKPAGFFSGGWEKHFAFVRLDVMRTQARSQNSRGNETIYHEYAHALLHANFRWLPVWFDEGFAEFYAYTRFQAEKTYIGAPSSRAAYTRDQTIIPVERLIAITRADSELRDENRVQVYYSEAWGLVHFLMVTPEMESGARVQRFLALLEKGMDQAQAFRQAIGEFKDIERQLLSYLQRPAYGVLVTDTLPIAEQAYNVRRLKPDEASIELANYQVWRGELEAARQRLDKLPKESADSAFVHETRGFLHFQEGKDAEALAEFERAAKLDQKLYLSRYYKTMLSPFAQSEKTDDREKLSIALREIIGVNPDFAAVYVQLARLFVRQGNLESALDMSKKAELIAPSRAGYHTLTGYILHAMGRDNEAADIARDVADRWPQVDHDEAVELWQQLPSEARGRDLTPWPAIRNTVSVSGTISSVQCDKKEKTITLVLDGNSRTFRMGDTMTGGFSDTLWFGGDYYSHCYHIQGLRAAIQYTPSSNAKIHGMLMKMDVLNNPIR